MLLRRIFYMVFAFSLMAGQLCYADDDVQKTLRQMQERIDALEKKVAEQERYIASQKTTVQAQEQKLAEQENKLSRFDEQLHRETGTPIPLIEGIDLGVGGTMVLQGTNNVNDSTDGQTLKESRTDASYSADITLGKEFEAVNGRAFLHLEAAEGAGLDDNLVLYSPVNYDAGDSEAKVEVTELWYEQGLFGESAVITAGKLDPTVYFDNNEIANDETTQFLGTLFGNSPTIEFPGNAAGVRVAYLPAEWLELSYGLFDGNSDWEEVGDNPFNIGQTVFKTNFFDQPGNYRFLAWHSNVDHTEWLDSSKTKEATYGFGLSFDQKITDITTVFCRYAWQNPKVYNPDNVTTGDNNFSLEHSWSTGLQFEGKPWGRENDALGFAVGQVFPSDDYKKAGSSTVTAPNAKAEGHLETYYRIFINDHLSISPDFQYIWNPFGKDVANDTSPIFIGGMRAQVDF